MGYKEIITTMQRAGLSSTESKETMELMVESIAERLDSKEKKDFAHQLPDELQSIALSALPAGLNDSRDILQEFMDREHVQEDYAKLQITAAWDSLKSLIHDAKMITQIKSFMPATVRATM